MLECANARNVPLSTVYCLQILLLVLLSWCADRPCCWCQKCRSTVLMMGDGCCFLWLGQENSIHQETRVVVHCDDQVRFVATTVGWYFEVSSLSCCIVAENCPHGVSLGHVLYLVVGDACTCDPGPVSFAGLVELPVAHMSVAPVHDGSGCKN